jgi:hypothetical protein
MKKPIFIIGVLMLMFLCTDTFAQQAAPNEAAAVGKAQGAARRECGPEPGPFQHEVIATAPCPGGGSSYVIFFFQPTPCFPQPGPCIQVIQPIATVTVDCEGNTTVVCESGGPIPIE